MRILVGPDRDTDRHNAVKFLLFCFLFGLYVFQPLCLWLNIEPYSLWGHLLVAFTAYAANAVWFAPVHATFMELGPSHLP